jgi:hypothetical protein
MLCLCFSVFFNGPGDSKHLGSAGRQADEYIAPGGKLFYFFYVSNFAYEPGYCIILFQNITLSKSSIHQQHKMYAKCLAKMLFAISTKYLKFGWDGHFVVTFVLLVSCSIPVFY